MRAKRPCRGRKRVVRRFLYPIYIRIAQIVAVLSILLALVFGMPVAAQQQTGAGWQGPVNLSNSETDSVSPSLAVDPGGQVHLVWCEKYDVSNQVILYSKLAEDGWTAPVDIFTGARGMPVLASDELGYLHLIWQGEGVVFYSRAYAPLAGSAQGWSAPLMLAPAQMYAGLIDLAVGSGEFASQVCFTYAKQVDAGSGIYVSCSFDRGESWSEAVLAYENNSPNQLVDKPRLLITPDGVIHVVWMKTNYPETFPPTGLGYSRSTDGGQTWESSVSLAEGPYDDPEITYHGEDEIHVVWSGTDIDRYKFHRWSADNGKTWFPMWRNKASGGLTGWPALVADSAGRMHWIEVGDVVGLGDVIYYNELAGQDWLPGSLVFREEVTGMHPVSPVAVISMGNRLHLAVATPVYLQDGSYQMEIYYFYRLLDAPALAAMPLPSPTATLLDATATVPVGSTVTTIDQVVNPGVSPGYLPSQSVLQSAWGPIVVGTLPVFLAIIGIILWRVFRRDR